MSDLRTRSAEGGAPLPDWRRWSVIVCSRRGRLHHLQVSLPDGGVRGCGCAAARHEAGRSPIGRQSPHDDAGRRPSRDADEPLAASSAWPAHGGSSEMLPPPPPPPPPQKGHQPPVDGSWLGSTPAAPAPLKNLWTLPPRPPVWMPTARRLLLEPAPRRRPSVYAGPALRPSQRSAFRPLEPPSFYCTGKIVYKLKALPVSMCGTAGLVVPQGVCVAGGPVAAERPAERPAPRAAVLHRDQGECALRRVDAVGPAGSPDSGRGHGDAREAASAPITNGGVRDVGETAEVTAAAITTTTTTAVATATAAATAAIVVTATTVRGKPGKARSEQRGGQESPEMKTCKRQWLLRVVRENFNEQIGLLVERFVRRPRHDKSVRRVPGIGRKVNVNLQDFWRRNSGQERHMKTKDLLTVYSDSGMDWKSFQKWLTKDLQFMPSCAKLCALSLDIYQKYWSTDWDDSSTTG